MKGNAIGVTRMWNRLSFGDEDVISLCRGANGEAIGGSKSPFLPTIEPPNERPPAGSIVRYCREPSRKRPLRPLGSAPPCVGSPRRRFHSAVTRPGPVVGGRQLPE